MTSLQDQMRAVFKKKVTDPHEQLVRKTGLIVLANVSLATPVKTGRARANWNLSIDTVDGTTTDSTSAPDLAAAAAKLKGFYIGKTIYVSNNLPYIKRLNDGYSKQAPANFVETGVALAKRQAKAGA